MATAETIGFDIRVTGDAPASAKMERVATSVRKLDTATNDAGKSFNAANEKIQKLSALFNSLDPVLGKLTGTMGKASAATSVFMSTIGGAPGLVLGGLVGALALWADAASAAEKETRALEEATKDAAKSALTLEDRIANLGKQRSAEDLQRRIHSGKASSVEIAGEIERLQAGRLVDATGGNTPAERQAIREANQNRRMLVDQRIEDLKIREAAARERERKELEDKDKKKGADTSFGPSLAGTQMDAVRMAGQERKEAFSEQMQALEEVRKQYENQERESMRLMREERMAAIDAEYEAAKSASEQRIEIRRLEAEEYERIESETAASQEARRQVAISGMQNVAGNTLGAIQKVAKGQKMTTAMFLESIGDQAFASGTAHILQGIALSVINPAQGGPLIAAGGAEAAFGLALGAAAARGAGGSMSRGGGSARASAGGGGGYSAEPVGMRSEQPQHFRSNVIVNVNANVVDDNAGAMIIQSIEEAQRKRGLRLSPEAVGRV